MGRIILLHGDDTAASRKALDEEIKRNTGTEVIYLDGSKVTMTEVITASESASIFSSDRLIVLENFLTGHKSKEKENILDYVQSQANARYILWEPKSIDKFKLKSYPWITPKTYDFPQLMFRFLDSLGSSKPVENLSMFHEILKTQDAELVFAMLLRQMRLLIIAKDLGPSGIPGVQPWQASKIASQSRYFSEEKLISSYRKLLAIDLKIKYGLSPLGYSRLLDIFLFNL